MALKESETISSITTLDLDLKDEKFQAGNISSYHLSLEISNKAIAWCILDKKENEVLALLQLLVLYIALWPTRCPLDARLRGF